MIKEYNLKFHEALKRAVEDGVQIEELDPRRDTYAYEYRDGTLHHTDGSGPSGVGLKSLTSSSWRVIEKPKRVEFETTIKRGWLSDRSASFPILAPKEDDLKSESYLMPLIDRKVKVTIEELP